MLPLWFEIVTTFVLLGILAFDLTLVFRKPHRPSTRECALWVAFYIVCALLFALCIFLLGAVPRSVEFLAGYITEYTLSIDNLFVFILIMSNFAIPEKYQQRALLIGIIIALLFRGVFIALGANLIEHFSWIFYVFGAWLLWTAYTQFKHDGDESLQKDGVMVRVLRRFVPVTDRFDGAKLTTVVDGKRAVTPFLLALVALGTTDLLFALDSIPAIFGITSDPFIVLTANIFALMALRQLYFLLGSLLEKLVFLHYGIAVILAFIGLKLVFHALHTNELPFIHGGHPVHAVPVITTPVSLGFIALTIVVSTVASLLYSRSQERRAKEGMGEGGVCSSEQDLQQNAQASDR